MRRLILSMVLASLSLVAADRSAAASVLPGFLEGNLKILTSGGAEPAEDTKPKSPSVNYAEYPLLILRKDSREEVARVTVDDKGHYRVSLPPGDYVLALKARSHKRVHEQLRPFTVVSQQTVRVDMELIVGLSVSQI